MATKGKKKTKPRINKRTGKPYDNESRFFKDWTTKKLLSEAKALHCMIDVQQCHSSGDVLELIGVSGELGERGYEGYATTKYRKG